jgi:hypothetical protein
MQAWLHDRAALAALLRAAAEGRPVGAGAGDYKSRLKELYDLVPHCGTPQYDVQQSTPPGSRPSQAVPLWRCRYLPGSEGSGVGRLPAGLHSEGTSWSLIYMHDVCIT